VNILFNWLKSICHYLAKQPEMSFSASQLSKSIGYYDAPLSAFVGGNQAPEHMRGLFGSNHKLQGWHCLDCGYSEVSSRSVESYIANVLIPAEVFRACEEHDLVRLVDDVLNTNLPSTNKLRDYLNGAISSSEINLMDHDGWMRPCPSCGSEDTGVYRWKLETNEYSRFVPSSDNLPPKH
jgi:hypothetical protein